MLPVFNITVDYKQNNISFIEGPSYRRVDRDLTDSAKRTTTPVIKRNNSHRRCRQKLRPAGSGPQEFLDFRRKIQRGVLYDPLSATLPLLPTNPPST